MKHSDFAIEMIRQQLLDMVSSTRLRVGERNAVFEAAEIIGQLTKERDEARKAASEPSQSPAAMRDVEDAVPYGGWISVEDRLPEKNGKYLCRYGFGSTDYLITDCLSYIATDQEPHWQHASMGLIVTHWMPLPEGPEEE